MIKQIGVVTGGHVKKYVCRPDDVANLPTDCAAGSETTVIDPGVIDLYIFDGTEWVNVTGAAS